MLFNKLSMPQDMVMGDDVTKAMLAQCAPGDTECVIRVLLGIENGTPPSDPGPGGGGGGGGGHDFPPDIPSFPGNPPVPEPPIPPGGGSGPVIPNEPTPDLLMQLAQSDPQLLQRLMEMMYGRQGVQGRRLAGGLVWGGGGGGPVPV